MAVFGSSEPVPGDPLYEQARRLGTLLAGAGHSVVTGGYGGVMQAACQGAREAGGRTLGIGCAIFTDRTPNPYLDDTVIAPDLFDRTRDGRILQRAFGGHTWKRLAHVGDRTGLEMIRTLQDRGVHQGIDVYMECAIIKLFMDGGKICGTIVRTFDDSGEYESPNKGKRLVLGMEAKGDGHYRGNVWRPSNDKIYVGKIDLSGNKLKLRGCVAGGLICSKQTWTRVQ